MRFVPIALNILLIAFLVDIGQAALIHQYTFNNGTADDAVGLVNGTVSGATINDGKCFFDGIDDYVSFGRLLPQSGPVTIVAWFNAPKDSSSNVFALGVNGQQKKWLYFRPNNTSIAWLGLRTDVTESTRLINLKSPLTDGTDHVVATVIAPIANERQKGTMTCYVDGVPMGSVVLTDANNLSKLDGSGNWLGRQLLAGESFYKGTIDEFRIYDEALTVDQIRGLTVAATEPPATAVLITAIANPHIHTPSQQQHSRVQQSQ